MKNCLIIIDMINGFVNHGALADSNIKRIIPGIKKAAKKMDQVVFVNDVHEKESSEFNSFPSHCLRGSSECEIVDQLKDIEGKVFEKNCTNAMFAPEFKQFIDETPAQVFYLAGCCVDICVLNLALSLQAYLNQNNINKKVKVVSNLVSTYNAPGHVADFYHLITIAIIKANGIKVVEQL